MLKPVPNGEATANTLPTKPIVVVSNCVVSLRCHAYSVIVHFDAATVRSHKRFLFRHFFGVLSLASKFLSFITQLQKLARERDGQI